VGFITRPLRGEPKVSFSPRFLSPPQPSLAFTANLRRKFPILKVYRHDGLRFSTSQQPYFQSRLPFRNVCFELWMSRGLLRAAGLSPFFFAFFPPYSSFARYRIFLPCTLALSRAASACSSVCSFGILSKAFSDNRSPSPDWSFN